MSVTPEELAAFADGELEGARAADVAAAVAAEPALQARVQAHRALKARLAAHFQPIAQAPVPARLADLLKPAAMPVVDIAAARRKRQQARALPRWSWVTGPALAASLALAVLWPRGGDYLEGPVVNVLENQLVAAQPTNAETRILLSFRTKDGGYCRAFTSRGESGIACRESGGWALAENGAATARQNGEYRQAGNDGAQLMERAQAMAAGAALDAAQEKAARARGWR